MKTINQRELRNDSAAVMRGVEQGETYTVTRRGAPIGRLSPVDSADLRCLRPARTRPVYSETPRVITGLPSGELLAGLRGER